MQITSTARLAAIAAIAGLVIIGPVGEAAAQARQRPQARPDVTRPHRPAVRPPVAHRPIVRPPVAQRPIVRPPHVHRPPVIHRPPVHRPPYWAGRPYYRDYAAWRIAAGVGAAIVVGTILASPPPQATVVVIDGVDHYLHNGAYYRHVIVDGRSVYEVVRVVR